jgi:hypothetical protein
MAVFKTTRFNRSRIPQGNFIRRIANSGVHDDVFLGFFADQRHWRLRSCAFVGVFNPIEADRLWSSRAGVTESVTISDGKTPSALVCVDEAPLIHLQFWVAVLGLVTAVVSSASAMGAALLTEGRVVPS